MSSRPDEPVLPAESNPQQPPAEAAPSAPAPPATEVYARRQLERLERSFKQLRRADPEAVHDARVASRRLDAALDVLLGRGSRDRHGPESWVLRRLRRRLGRLREREVIAQTLRIMLEKAPLPTREAGDMLLGRLAKRITRGRKRAMARIQKAHREVTSLRSAAELRSVPDLDAMVLDARRWQDERRAAALKALRVGLQSRDSKDLHEARLALKKWRYALEVRAETTGMPEEAERKEVTSLQGCLGAIHDGDVLLEFLRRWSRRWRRDGSRELATALAPLLRRLGSSRRRELRRLELLAGHEKPPEPSPESPEP